MQILSGKVSRRSLLNKGLKSLAAAGAGAQALSLFQGQASAAGGFLDRAVVCIYLNGGSDGNNMVVPMEQYKSYGAARPRLAVPERLLLQSRAISRTDAVGFHPALAELKNLFDMRALGVVANVGRRQRAALPGTPSTVDPKDFLVEQDAESEYVYPGGRIPAWASALPGVGELWRSSVFSGFPSMPGFDSVDITKSDVTLTSNKSHPAVGPERIEFEKSLRVALKKGVENVRTVFPRTGIGNQLLQVAGFLRTAPAMGINRPVFQCSHSGFSDLRNRAADQDRILRELSSALAAFHAATNEMGAASRVTTYTVSQCGRSLAENAAGGAEPGWGNNYFVMGGSVMGGDVYGEFPYYTLGGLDDAGRTGIWRPTIATDEFSAVFARWMGLNVHQMPRTRHAVTGYVAPNLNFLIG